MSKFKQMLLVSFAILIALNAAACGAMFPAATPTPENTPLPTGSPTLEDTPLPTGSPTPLPYLPTLEGAVDIAGDFGGFKLHYQCFGEGTPTIIVEAGGGDTPITTLTWKSVIQKTQSITRICIYDRLDTRTSQGNAENLHILLEKIPLPGPYILVAHSLGGFHARVFTHLYPQEVAGLILVDTTVPFNEASNVIATAYPTYTSDEKPIITQAREKLFNTPAPNTYGNLDVTASEEQVRQSGSFGELPLIVISENPDPLGVDPITGQQIAPIILKVQANLAATLSSKGVFIVAKTSNHFISVYEPQIIIDAIARMVAEIRKH